MDITERTQLPVTYRQEVVSPVMQCILAGESCAIIGIAGTGKSNLIRLLARSDVQEKYLGPQRSEFLFVLVDLNRLTQLSEWGFWELLLHRVTSTLAQMNAEPGLLTRLGDLHQRAAMARDELVAQRCFETCVGILCTEVGRRLVFLFDPFDDVWRSLCCRAFQVLRSLRDEFKYQVSYVVATRDELARLREGVDSCHDFYEIVALHTYGLGPHSVEDAANQLARLMARRGKVLTEEAQDTLMRLTACHPGLLRASYWAWADGKADLEGEPAKALADTDVVRQECAEIWNSLGEDERGVLLSLASGQLPAVTDRGTLDLLKLKGLVSLDSRGLFCALFEVYVRGFIPSGPRRLFLNKDSGQVVVEGKPIAAELTRTELTLLGYLYDKRGQVCDREELLRAVYPNETRSAEDAWYDRLYDRRLDTVVRRLRDKIEPDRDHPRYILTVRDRGYKLAVDEE